MKLNSRAVSHLVRSCLRDGRTIELEGLGAIRRDRDGRSYLVRDTRPRVFIAYAIEDREQAERVADALQAAGFDAWMDRRKLMPGQNWRRAIAQAIEVADYFVACFSTVSLTKRGGFQRELRMALEVAQTVPLDRAFLIPVRLNQCEPPREFASQSQWVDAFPDLSPGMQRLVRAIRKHERQRMAKPGLE